MNDATDAPEQQDLERKRVVEWATESEMLPEILVNRTSRRTPLALNPKHWIYRAVLARTGWTPETTVTQRRFVEVVATVENVTVR